MYINHKKDLYMIQMRRLKVAMVVIQITLLLSLITFLALYLSTDLLTENDNEMKFIEELRLAERYYTGGVMFCIMITLAVLDVILLRRLKVFYPGFY